MTPRPAHPRRRPVVVALTAAAAVLVASGAAVASTDRDTLPYGTATIEGQETPVLGSFVYHQFHLDTNPEIRGLVHGVRRVDGGTAVYYSIGTPEGGDAPAFTGAMAFPNSSAPYSLSHGTDLTLVDSAGLTAYRPLYSGSTTFTSQVADLDGEAGTLRVGWAVFPELTEDAETVQVIMPWGTAVGDVPVEDGALEPVASEPGPLLGEGWPEVPSGADLAGADPAAVTYSLTRRTGDEEGTAQVEESVEQVAVTLDANVLFASGSAELSGEAQQVLGTIASDIAARGTGEVVVTGHTDSDGSDPFNQTLSEQRAAAVLAVLQPASGSAVTFAAVGKGETEPVAGNDTDEGKQANRRVTVVYSVQGDK
ncbi:OmpA family protein [Cellulomonas sp. NPDC055163]